MSDRAPVVRVESDPGGLTVLTLDSPPLNLKQVREAAEQQAIGKALKATENNITDAASALGITRPTLYNLLDKYGMKP